MHLPRTVTCLISCVLLAALLGLPASATAAVTAPTLKTPAAGTNDIAEGGSLEFEWQGTLQGDSDELARSFFRVEVIAAADLPSTTQAEWPTPEAFVQTESGEATTSATIGVPSAGDWRWRVCAWGVADSAVSQSIEQLPGGCSASRSFTTVAASVTRGAIGQVTVEEKTIVEGEVKKVIVERPSTTPATAVETPTETSPPIVEEEAVVAATFSPITSRSGAARSSDTTTEVSAPSSVALGEEGLAAAANRDGVSGSVLGGLTGTLPLLPIPFWTLALLLACLPLAQLWRRSVLGMFDQPEDSALKVSSITADGDAPAEPELERLAA